MWFEDAIGWILGMLVAIVLVIVSCVCWYVWAYNQQPTFNLKRSDWNCTKSEQRTHLQPTLVVKSTVMMPVTNTVCIEYARRSD